MIIKNNKQYKCITCLYFHYANQAVNIAFLMSGADKSKYPNLFFQNDPLGVFEEYEFEHDSDLEVYQNTGKIGEGVKLKMLKPWGLKPVYMEDGHVVFYIGTSPIAQVQTSKTLRDGGTSRTISEYDRIDDGYSNAVTHSGHLKY